jgi:penicillin-binding protein 2
MMPDDRSSLTYRLSAMQYGLAIAFAAVAVCFWYLQVLQHESFVEMAENNHQRTLALRAPRGVLFDRHGKVLVQNRDALNISLVREQAGNLDVSVRLLAAVTGIEERSVREVVDRNRSVPRYRPLMIVHDASMDQVAAVKARRRELRDVIVEEVPTRKYPEDEFGAHLFGYVGEITEAQIARPENEGLTAGTLIGQAGVEQTYNKLLMGRDGAKLVNVNSLGREIKEVERLPSVEGTRLQLTIDYDIQKAAQDGFEATGYQGSAVMLDPNNGEILALLSRPAFDPNAFSGGIDARSWQRLLTDPLRPLQNRAIQGRYSPGSTFKIVVATAGLEEGIITPEFRAFCPGGAYFFGRWFKCHAGGPHGSVDLRHAIEKSCNVYFYTVGNMVGIDRLHKWATALGLGVMSGVDLPHEIEGIMPSPAWKRAKKGEKWYAGETISVSIGQGAVSVTPVSLAVMMMTVANGGTRFQPHLLRATDDGSGWKPFPPPAPRSVVRMKQSTIDAVHDGLWMVVNGAGTGGRARIDGRDVAGKTGTAQVISIEGRQRAGRTERDLRDHGFFAFFAPAKHPEVAGVVFAEHSEHGSSAAPIARHMIETYFAKKEGKPLPAYPVPVVPTPPPPATTTVVAAGTAAPPARPGGGR